MAEAYSPYDPRHHAVKFTDGVNSFLKDNIVKGKGRPACLGGRHNPTPEEKRAAEARAKSSKLNPKNWFGFIANVLPDFDDVPDKNAQRKRKERQKGKKELFAVERWERK